MAKYLYFPDILQNTDFSCGNSCMQAVLAYYGYEYTERKLIKLLKTSSKWGTKSELMVKFFEQKRFEDKKNGKTIFRRFKVKHGSFTQEDLKKFIRDEVPVIILIQAWGEEGMDYTNEYEYGHYVVVSGYNDKGFIIEDPGIFGRGFISFSQMKKRWHADDEKKMENWGMAVFGPQKYDYTKLYRIT
jgi:uncharacterized protein